MNRPLLCTVLASAAVFFFISSTIFGQADTLTIDRCVKIALNNNPQIKIAVSNYDLSSSNLVNTRSVLYPQILLQSNAARNGGSYFIGPTSRTANYNNFSAGFQGSQLIFDFGKTFSKISGMSDLETASGQDLISAKQNLILNTYIAYFSYLQSERIRKVNEESLLQAGEHLKEALNFYKVGTKPQFDVIKAKADEASARVNLITAQNNLILNRLQLENILNIKLSDKAVFKDNLEINKDTISLENATLLSIQNRPEILGGKARVDANKSFLTSAWTAYLPSINATGGYTWRGFDLNQPFLNSWNLGLSISIPIFQGFQLDAGVDQARANLKNAEAQYEYIAQTINLDVQQQYVNLKLSLAKIDAAKSLLHEAEETFKLAEGRYKEGVGSPIEITDAMVTLLNAQTTNIQALYDYQVAFVRLQKAIGTLK